MAMTALYSALFIEIIQRKLIFSRNASSV